MTPDRKMQIGITVAAMAAQGVVVGNLMAKAYRISDQATYMADLLNRNIDKIDITEFDQIALTQLGLFK